jgi:hypothetical protein
MFRRHNATNQPARAIDLPLPKRLIAGSVALVCSPSPKYFWNFVSGGIANCPTIGNNQLSQQG